MFNMGGGEMILVAVVALLLIPPKKLPQVATTLGRWFHQMQRGIGEIKQNMEVNLKPDFTELTPPQTRATPTQKNENEIKTQEPLKDLPDTPAETLTPPTLKSN